MTPTSPPSAHAIASQLIRTRPERARLDEWLDGLAAARGRLVLVTGPTGVGKTRLLAELAAAAEQRQQLVLRADGTAGHPLAPIASLIGALGQLEPSEATAYERWQKAPLGEGESASAATERRRHYDRLAHALAAAARRQPTVVLFADLDDADPALGELFAHLADGLFAAGAPALPLLLVASSRTRPRLEPSVVVDELALAPLDKDAIRALLATPAIVDFFAETTGGQLSALLSLLHHLPTDLSSLFAARLDRLSASARAVLELLALAKRELGMEDLVHAFRLAVRPTETLRAALEELQQARLVEAQSIEGMLTFSLCERAERETIVAGLAPDSARVWHTLLAEVARRHAASSHTPVDDTVAEAEHLIAAAAGERAVDAAVRAAELLRQVAAPHRAIALYRRAAALTTREELRGDLDRRLHALEVDIGDYQSALESAERLRRREASVGNLLLLARTHLLRDEHALALAVLDQGLAANPDPEARAELTALGAEAHYLRGDRRRAGEVVEAALPSVQSATHRIELCNTLGKVRLAAGQLDAAAELFAQNISAAVAASLPREECRARFNLGIVELQRGQRGAAESGYRAALAIAERSGDVRNRAFVLQNLAVLRHWSSDFADAIALFREAIGAFRQLGQRGRLAWLAHDLGSVYLDLGDSTEAETLIDLAERYAAAAPSPSLDLDRLLLRGRLAILAGALPAARTTLASALELAQQSGDRARARRAHLLTAEAALAVTEPTELAEAARACKQALAAAQAEDPTPREQAELHYLDGRRLLAAGEPQAALEVLQPAVRLAESLPDLDLAWRALFALAEAHHLDRPAWAPRRERRRVSPHVRRLLERADAIWHRVAQPLAEGLRTPYEQTAMRRRLVDFLAGGEGNLDGSGAADKASPAAASSAPALGLVVAAPAAPPSRPFRLVGSHPRLTEALALIDRVAPFDSPVLIRGESGTGKELVADEIWARSSRAGRPIVKVNCGALVESLLLSELFGHEKGAFTGAHARKKGCFEAAHGGTLFLDEIGDISSKTQVALLRVLQEREFLRVGGNDPVKVDVRILFATHRNLEEMVQKGVFREDLYYRLRGIQIDLPALRERPSDVTLLATALLAKIARERGETPKTLDAEAEAMCRAHRWPGNVRELDNTLRSVSLFADGAVITAADLLRYTDLGRGARSLGNETPAPTSFARMQSEQLSLRELKTQIEIECIAKALRETRGNITRAAEKLGMKRPRLSQLIKQYGLGLHLTDPPPGADLTVVTSASASKEQV